MVVRTPWQNFPPVALHAAEVPEHSDYAAATEGDAAAAARVVGDLINPLLCCWSADFVVPLQRWTPGRGWNALPLALATAVAKRTGARVLPLIVQDNIIPDRGPNALDRISRQPSFAGPVPSGRYVIATDHVSFGSGVANLRGYIESMGGTAEAATSLGSDIHFKPLRPEPDILSAIRRKFDGADELIPSVAGFAVDQLTTREAYFVYALPSADYLIRPAEMPPFPVFPLVIPEWRALTRAK